MSRYNAELAKENYYWHKNNNWCVLCHKNRPEPSRTMCYECLMKRAEYGESYRKRETQEQKEKHKESWKKRYNEYREQGLCPICGKQPMDEKHAFCLEHTLEQRERSRRCKEKKKEYKQVGLCSFSGCYEPVVPGKCSCEKHYKYKCELMKYARESENNEGRKIVGKQIDVFWRERKASYIKHCAEINRENATQACNESPPRPDSDLR